MANTNEKLTRLSALQLLTQQLKGMIPAKVSELTNDSNFQTDTQVASSIQAAISASGHAHFEKVSAVPEVDAAQENTLYLVRNAKTGHYDIYAKIAGETGFTMELLDDTTVDLSAYATSEAVTAGLAGKVNAEDGKGLSSNDYTNEEKAKLAGLEIATDEEVNAMLAEVFGA